MELVLVWTGLLAAALLVLSLVIAQSVRLPRPAGTALLTVAMLGLTLLTGAVTIASAQDKKEDDGKKKKGKKKKEETKRNY